MNLLLIEGEKMKEAISVKKAVLINATGKYSKILLSLVVNAILARILSPEDYGIVAVITVFSTFFTTFSDMGFGPAIIQNKTLTKDDINNIYSFTVYISVILMIIFGLCTIPISFFYNDSIYIPLGLILSISLLFNAMNMVPNGILNREKRFVVIAVRTVLVYVVAAIFSIFLALIGFRYYALAIQAVISAFLQFIWNYFTTKPKFKFKFDFGSIKKVLNYSGFQFAFNVVNYFSRNLDNLLTGKFMGNKELGYYNKAYTLMLYPVNNLTGVVSPVLHPILSDYQNQKDIIYQKYIRIVKLLMCMGIFISPFCFLASREIITIMYGNNWNDSIVCFQILSIAIIPQMINSSAGGIFQAIGNTKLLFINSCINTLITVSAILFGVLYGKTIVFLSFCVAIAYIFHFCTAFFMLITMGFKFNIMQFVKDIFREFVILAVMIIVENIWLSIAIKLIYLAIIYVGGLLLTKEHKLFLQLFKKKKKNVQ